MKAIGDIALIDFFLLAALLLTTILIVWGGLTSVKSALIAGRLAIRGAVYDRTKQPLMYWLGVLFWVALSIVMIGFNVFAVMAVFRAPG